MTVFYTQTSFTVCIFSHICMCNINNNSQCLPLFSILQITYHNADFMFRLHSLACIRRRHQKQYCHVTVCDALQGFHHLFCQWWRCSCWRQACRWGHRCFRWTLERNTRSPWPGQTQCSWACGCARRPWTTPDVRQADRERETGGSKRLIAGVEIYISWRISYPQHPCSSGPTSCRFIQRNDHDSLVRLCSCVTNLLAAMPRAIMKAHTVSGSCRVFSTPKHDTKHKNMVVSDL